MFQSDPYSNTSCHCGGGGTLVGSNDQHSTRANAIDTNAELCVMHTNRLNY